jgi:hypothetical protein
MGASHRYAFLNREGPPSARHPPPPRRKNGDTARHTGHTADTPSHTRTDAGSPRRDWPRTRRARTISANGAINCPCRAHALRRRARQPTRRTRPPHPRRFDERLAPAYTSFLSSASADAPLPPGHAPSGENSRHLEDDHHRYHGRHGPRGPRRAVRRHSSGDGDDGGAVGPTPSGEHAAAHRGRDGPRRRTTGARAMTDAGRCDGGTDGRANGWTGGDGRAADG